jgi:hypothetical protein
MTSENNPGIWRALRGLVKPERGSVHFHIDADGRAFVCYSGRCGSTALTLNEVSLTETGARRRAV